MNLHLQSEKLLRWAFLAAFGLLLATGIGAVWELRTLAHASARLEVGYRLVQGVEDALSALKDAETGQRGFLLTARPDYLQPYQQAVQSIPGLLEPLGRLAEGDPAQQRRLGQFNALAAEKLREMSATVRLASAGQREAALAVVEGGEGKRLMDALREVSSQMRASAGQQVEDRARQTRGLQQTLQGVLLGVVLIGLSLALVAWMLRRQQQRHAAEREALYRRERTAREAAEQASHAKDEFVAVLSHELRTPLNAILGWSQVLQRLKIGNETARGALAAIDRNARAQEQLIADLFDMSRILAGKLRLEVGPVDLHDIVAQAIESVQLAADARDIRIQAVLDAQAGLVMGDSSRLQQVLCNLLANAIKFSPKGRRVQVVMRRVNSHVDISVADHGEGIDAAFLPHVFERYRQSDTGTAREHGGLGLGLSIVKQLVELHGGVIHAYSDGAGKGATFVVTLPVAAAHHDAHAASVHGIAAAAPPAAPTEVIAVAGTTPGQASGPIDGVRVLAVDDDPDARQLIASLLLACGAAVEVAGSARDALRLAEVFEPQLLLSDIGMSSMDGFELLRQFRALEAERGATPIPAIALTAYARQEDRAKSLHAGFQAHLTKPVNAQELVATIASLCRLTQRP